MPADVYDLAKDKWVVTMEPSPQAPGRQVFTVTPDDNKDITNATVTDPAPVYPKSLYIGVAGDVSVIAANDRTNGGAGTAKLFKAHPVGYLQLQVRRVMSANTTATNILAICDT